MCILIQRYSWNPISNILCKKNLNAIKSLVLNPKAGIRCAFLASSFTCESHGRTMSFHSMLLSIVSWNTTDYKLFRQSYDTHLRKTEDLSKFAKWHKFSISTSYRYRIFVVTTNTTLKWLQTKSTERHDFALKSTEISVLKRFLFQKTFGKTVQNAEWYLMIRNHAFRYLLNLNYVSLEEIRPEFRIKKYRNKRFGRFFPSRQPEKLYKTLMSVLFDSESCRSVLYSLESCLFGA